MRSSGRWSVVLQFAGVSAAVAVLWFAMAWGAPGILRQIVDW